MVSQALVDRPCLFRQQPTDQDVHISRVCFLEQEYDKQPPAGSLVLVALWYARLSCK